MAGRWGVPRRAPGTCTGSACHSRHHTRRFCCGRKVRKTKSNILTWVRAPHGACIRRFSDVPDNCLIPRLKKLLFPVRAELTAQRAKGVTLHLCGWVCMFVCARLCACLAAICFGPPPHLATAPKPLLKIPAFKQTIGKASRVSFAQSCINIVCTARYSGHSNLLLSYLIAF